MVRGWRTRGWLASVASLGLLAAMVATAAPSGAAPPRPPVFQPLPLLHPTELNVSNDPAHKYGESQVAVNPTNPNNIVYVSLTDSTTLACFTDGLTDPNSPCFQVPTALAGGGTLGPLPQGTFTMPGSSRISVFVSFDRGVTWANRTLDLPLFVPNPPDPNLRQVADPGITVTADGTFYLSFDASDWGTPSLTDVSGGIGMSKSTDGGLTWSEPVLTGTSVDLPRTVADLSTGTIYENSGLAFLGTPGGARATGIPFPTAPISDPAFPGDRYLVASQDGVNWSTPRGLGGLDTSTTPPTYDSGGSSVMAAARGYFATVFLSTSPGACKLFVATTAPCIVFQRTHDDGVTWQRHAVTTPGGTTPPITSNIVLAADPTTDGHYTVAGTTSTNQFLLYQTYDGGAKWTAGATVTDGNPNAKFHDWLTYSPAGSLGLMWLARQAPGTSPYLAWAAFSEDGGATFGPPVQVSGSPSPPAPAGLSGADDFSHITMRDDVAFISWADWRPGGGTDRSAFFGAVRFLDYDFSGFLPPLDGSTVRQSGSTLPVEFRLSVKGQNVSWATATLNIDGAPAVSTVPNQGDAFRYDSATQQYMFNASTKGLTPGAHTLTVTLDDGTTHSVPVILK